MERRPPCEHGQQSVVALRPPLPPVACRCPQPLANSSLLAPPPNKHRLADELTLARRIACGGMRLAAPPTRQLPPCSFAPGHVPRPLPLACASSCGVAGLTARAVPARSSASDASWQTLRRTRCVEVKSGFPRHPLHSYLALHSCQASHSRRPRSPHLQPTQTLDQPHDAAPHGGPLRRPRAGCEAASGAGACANAPVLRHPSLFPPPPPPAGPRTPAHSCPCPCPIRRRLRCLHPGTERLQEVRCCGRQVSEEACLSLGPLRWRAVAPAPPPPRASSPPRPLPPDRVFTPFPPSGVLIARVIGTTTTLGRAARPTA